MLANPDLLKERMLLGDGGRALATFRYAGVLPTGGQDMVLRAAEVLAFPVEDVSPAYMHTMLNILPGEDGESSEQARLRIQETAGELVGCLSRIASGETVSTEEVIRIDDVVVAARKFMSMGECLGFGRVVVNYAVN